MVLGLDIDARQAAYPGLHLFDLKDGILYGPIPSRRLGLSLGINFLPYGNKTCSWDCLYCQCGWTGKEGSPAAADPARFPTVAELSAAFEEGFPALAKAGQSPDTLTLSGNGEPTLHPRFGEAVDALIRSRDRHLPKAKISILSNAERAAEPEVRAALMRLDARCMKLDAGDAATTERLDRPLTPFDLDRHVAALAALRPVLIQSFFVAGALDNTGPGLVAPWLDCLGKIAPEEVHLYSLDRVPPAKGLQAVPKAVLEGIAGRVRARGIPARVFA